MHAVFKLFALHFLQEIWQKYVGAFNTQTLFVWQVISVGQLVTQDPKWEQNGHAEMQLGAEKTKLLPLVEHYPTPQICISFNAPGVITFPVTLKQI